MPPMSPGVLPVSVPYNPSNPMTGSAPSLYIPSGVQTRPPPSGNSPSPTTSTPTNLVPQVTISRSDTQSSASSASGSPSGSFPPEHATALGASSQGIDGEGESNEQEQGTETSEETRVHSYVDFTDFNRQVDELGADNVYGWDNPKPAAPTTPV